MISKKQGAAAQTTAQIIEQRCRSYPKRVRESNKNLQQDIGELLFCLEFPVGQELSLLGWALLEQLLRRYMGLGVPPQSVHKYVESTISPQRVSG